MRRLKVGVAASAVLLLAACAPAPVLPLPVITGDAVVGQVLNVTTGGWAFGPETFSYKWKSCISPGSGCSPVGADAPSYTIAESDVGKVIQVTVTAANAVGQASSTAEPIGPVDPVTPPGFTVTNTTATGESWVLHDGDLVAFLQRESDEAADLNGDGDQLDFSPAVWNTSTNNVTNLGTAIEGAPAGVPTGVVLAGDGVVGVAVSESKQGGADLNVDGDTADRVLHVWTAGGGLVNLGVASEFGYLHGSAGAVATMVSEAAQNADLDGDGDKADRVLHVWTAGGGLVNLGVDSEWPSVVAGTDGRFLLNVNPVGPTSDRYAVYHASTNALATSGFELIPGFDETDASSGGNFALAATEFGYDSGGSIDLNGDGDKTDTVLHIWDGTASPANVGVAIDWGFVWDLDDGGFLVGVDEADQGGTDRNGDGDTADVVAHVWTPLGGLVNLEVDMRGFAPSERRLAGGGFAAFGVAESYQGNTDLNGDGDTADRVIHLWSAGTGLLNTALAAQFDPAAGDGGVGFYVSESQQSGTDLNADGDGSDHVAHAWSPGQGVVNLALAGTAAPSPAGTFIGFSVFEPANGGTDLNGNGSAFDTLVYGWNPDSGSLDLAVSFGVVSVDYPQHGRSQYATLSRMAVFVPESGGSVGDLNGDGDTFDDVLHVARFGP